MASTDQSRSPSHGPPDPADPGSPPSAASPSGTPDLLRTAPAQPNSPQAEDTEDDALAAWEARLRDALDDLCEREAEALAHDASPGELLAFAAEHDKIAIDRDSIAASYDERAVERDRVGLRRDVKGSGRDRAARAVADDQDEGFPDRSFAGQDRDSAAGDRGDSHDDRSRGADARTRAADDRATAASRREDAAERAAADRHELDGLRAALESRNVIGQAQGMLMARHNMTTDAAFAVLVRLSQHSNVKLRDVAARIVADFAKDRE